MRLDVPRREFHEAAAMANVAAAGRTSIELLQSLKLEANDTGLRILGCDGELWVERTVPCAVHEIGSWCVSGKLLVDLLGSLPDGDLHLEVDGHALVLSQGPSVYRVNVHDPADFPEIPDLDGQNRLAMPADTLKSAIDSVLYAVAKDGHRQILTGVLFECDGATLRLVSTDTHRLALRRIELSGDGTGPTIGSELNYVLPEKALRLARNLPAPEGKPIEIRFAERRMAIDVPSVRLVSQLIEGTFPAYERVIPTEFTRTWTVEIDQLAEKIKRTMILARDNAGRVCFFGDGDQLILTARSEEKGEAKEEVPMLSTGPALETAFNGAYVLDVLNALSGMGASGVRIEITEGQRPAVFRSADDLEGYLAVIMPMALR